MAAHYLPVAPAMLESYDIDGRVLGKGSFGIVVEAIERETHEIFAVKITERNIVGTDDISNCKNEAEILSKLHHPNIIRFHSYLEDPTRNYMFTEVIRGGELFDRLIEKNGFVECESRTIASKILSAIAYCHRHGIVHRDIKAENVLLVSPSDTEDFDLRVIDFGFAAAAKGTSLKGELGTPDYMAPEIWGGEKSYGAPVDMWALGVLVYMILVSYPPFLDHTALGIKAKIIRGIYEFHPEYWGHISQEAKDFVSRLLTVDVKLRMTAEEALKHPWFIMDRKMQPPDHPVKCFLSDREEEEELLNATEWHDDQSKRPTRKRRAKYFYTAPMAINRMKRLYSHRKNGHKSSSIHQQCIYGYLASLSVDTCSEHDGSSVTASGYDSDSTGQRTPSFGSSYIRNQLSSMTYDELHRFPTKALYGSSSNWALHTMGSHEKAEKDLISRAAHAFCRREPSISSQGTDTECSSGTASTKSSTCFNSISSDPECHFDVSQILLELARVDEND